MWTALAILMGGAILMTLRPTPRPGTCSPLSHGLSTYAIDPATGKLTKLKGSPVGQNPNWVEIVDLP